MIAEAKQEESSHDVYDDDSSDYEDNLQVSWIYKARIQLYSLFLSSYQQISLNLR